MNIAAKILKWMGWTVTVTVPDYPKCIICVAPHTSNADFFICKLAYASIGRRAGFMMKSTWFFPPLGWIFRSMGGVPVVRSGKGHSLVDAMIERFKNVAHLHLAITPEGTRSRTEQWRTGFLRIAHGADVPIVLAVLDFKTKNISATTTFITTGNVEADMAEIKRFYRSTQAVGRRPENFSA